MNSYRAWPYETFWMAVQRNREIPFNQVIFPTIDRNRNKTHHPLYKLHLKPAGFLGFSLALTHCEELFWDRLGCFTPWPRMLGGQILASGHGQQKGIRCWDIASPTLSAKGSLRPLWAVVDRCHSSHHAGCDVRGSSACSHYLLPRELRRSAGRVSVHKGCFSVLQKGLSCST